MGLSHLALWGEFDLKLGLVPSLGGLQAWWPGEGTGGMMADCFSVPTLRRDKDHQSLLMPVLSLVSSFKKIIS